MVLAVERDGVLKLAAVITQFIRSERMHRVFGLVYVRQLPGGLRGVGMAVIPNGLWRRDLASRILSSSVKLFMQRFIKKESARNFMRNLAFQNALRNDFKTDGR